MDESKKGAARLQSDQHGTHTSLAFPRGETGMGRSPPAGDLGGEIKMNQKKQGPDLSTRPLRCQRIGIYFTSLR